MQIRIGNHSKAVAHTNKARLYNFIIQEIEGLGLYLDFNIRVDENTHNITLKFITSSGLEKSVAEHLINKIKTDLIRPDEGYFKFNNEINKY